MRVIRRPRTTIAAVTVVCAALAAFAATMPGADTDIGAPRLGVTETADTTTAGEAAANGSELDAGPESADADFGASTDDADADAGSGESTDGAESAAAVQFVSDTGDADGTDAAKVAADAVPVPDRAPSVPDAAVESLRLSGASTATAGERFTLTLSAAEYPGAAGYEGILAFDDATVSLLDATASAGELVTVARPVDGVAVAVLPDGATPAGDLTLEFLAPADGTALVEVLSPTVVDADGARLSTGPVAHTVTIGAGGPTARSATPAWTVPTATDGDPDAGDLDITGDGHVTTADVSEAFVAWTSGHVAGDPCDLDATDALADVTGDGCVDVADLVALRGASVGDTVPTPRGQAFATGGPDVTVDSVAPFVVTTTNDGHDTQLQDDTCVSHLGGGCSLRAAILQANATPGPNRIEFDLGGTGTHTIRPNSRLPAINDSTGPLLIDGYTQTGASENTDPSVSNAVLRVQIRGLGDDEQKIILPITSSDNEVRGLAFYDTFYGIQVTTTNAERNRIVGNFLGTNAAATYDHVDQFSLGASVWVYSGPKDTVVGTPALADRNIISGARTVGVKIEQSNTRRTVVQNNILGLRPDGNSILGNNSGIDLQWWTSENVIGGTGPNERNVFSGNRYVGVDLSHSIFDNTVIGNYFGTEVDGTGSFGTAQDGLMIKDNPNNNEIAHNVFAGNGRYGIWNKHNYTDANWIHHNLIGVSADGSANGNAYEGIYLTGESDTIEHNVIAHNGGPGIYVNDFRGDANNYPDELTRENRISKNSFYDNDGLAIDIEPYGVNNNDPGDNDSGVHNLLNFPDDLVVTGTTVTGTACAGCEVELYVADPGPDSHGEGRQYVATAIADGSGDFALTNAVLDSEAVFTMLAIDPADNTSEFSPRFGGSQGEVVVEADPVNLRGAFYYTNYGGQTIARTELGGGSRNDNGANGVTSKVDLHFTLPSAGIYRLEADVLAPDGASNSFWIQVDGSPSNGNYWHVYNTSSSITTQDVTLDGNSSQAYELFLDAGSHTVTLTRREYGAGIARMRMIGGSGGSGGPNDPPSITSPGNQYTDHATAVSLGVPASDPNNDTLTFYATGLPSGLSIDSLTGVVSGTTTTEGIYNPTVHVTDGQATDSTTFTWEIGPPNQGPVFTDPGPQIGGLDDAVNVPIEAIDPEDDPITFSATGLPPGLSINPATGIVTGTYTTMGTFESTITATDGDVPTDLAVTWTVGHPTFACTVDGPSYTLTWTDQGASAYYVRHLHAGADDYVGSTSGLSMNIGDLDGTYLVRHFVGGTMFQASCDGPGNPVYEPFECSVDAVTQRVSWTDQGAAEYHIRHLLGGNDVYVGSSTTLSKTVTNFDGTYVIRHFQGATMFQTTCDGPGDPVGFVCSVDGPSKTVWWTDQGASTYYIRHLLDSTDTYVGSSTTLNRAIADLDGTYVIRYYDGPTRFETTCDGPGDPVYEAFSCSIDAATNTLSWTDQGAETYYVRHLIDGNDNYVGSSTTLSLSIPSSAGTYVVKHYPGPNAVQTECSLP